MSRGRVIVDAVMVTVFALVCILAMEWLAINIGQSKVITHGYQVRALFANADGVPPAADVRVAGIVVGKVTDIGHDPAHPETSVVTMEITDDRAVPLYSNAMAKVRPKTLLGEKYVDLVPGDRRGQQIPADGTLPEASTSSVVEIDQFLNAFDAQTRRDQGLFLQALDAATKQRAGDLQAIIPQLQQGVANLVPVAQVYEKDNPEMARILTNLATVMSTLGDEHDQLGGLLANGNTALGAIAQRDQALITTLREASNVAGELNAAVAPTVDAQRRSLAKLTPALGAERTFLGSVVDPNPGCPNKPSCGIDEIFSGTLLGQLNYPNDQLTITSSDGLTVTKEWASMFSPPPGQHSSLSLDLSFHCDTVQTTLDPVLSALGLQSAVKAVCPQLTGQGAATQGAALLPTPLAVLAAFAGSTQ